MNDSIDDRALDSVSVAPGGAKAEEGNRPDQPSRQPEQDAGQDDKIAGELQSNPDDIEARAWTRRWTPAIRPRSPSLGVTARRRPQAIARTIAERRKVARMRQ